jgi:hypothetical protein
MKIKDSLLGLSRKYKTTSPPSDIEKFVAATQTGTGDRDQRIVRVSKIIEYIENALPI